MSRKILYKKIESKSFIKELFGNQLKKYRNAVGLTQDEYAGLLSTDQSYINKLEQGKLNPSLETMQAHADLFGVLCHELMNPAIEIPPIAEMPAKIRKAAKAAQKARSQKEADQQAQKEAGKPIYQTGTAKQLHQLIADGFFKRPRTSKEAYEKLHGKLNPGRQPEEIQKAIGTITGTLRNGRFAKVLAKLEPTPGSTAVRFVIKDPNIIKYPDAHAGTKDIAADEG